MSDKHGWPHLAAPKTIAAEERRRAACRPAMLKTAAELGLPPEAADDLQDQWDDFFLDALIEIGKQESRPISELE